MRSHTYQLIEERLGDEDLKTFVDSRRPMAWDRIARELSDRVGFYVSHTALMRWFPKDKAKSA